MLFFDQYSDIQYALQVKNNYQIFFWLCIILSSIFGFINMIYRARIENTPCKQLFNRLYGKTRKNTYVYYHPRFLLAGLFITLMNWSNLIYLYDEYQTNKRMVQKDVRYFKLRGISKTSKASAQKIQLAFENTPQVILMMLNNIHQQGSVYEWTFLQQFSLFMSYFGLLQQVKTIIAMLEEGKNIRTKRLRNQMFISVFNKLCESSPYYQELNSEEKSLLTKSNKQILK